MEARLRDNPILPRPRRDPRVAHLHRFGSNAPAVSRDQLSHILKLSTLQGLRVYTLQTIRDVEQSVVHECSKPFSTRSLSSLLSSTPRSRSLSQTPEKVYVPYLWKVSSFFILFFLTLFHFKKPSLCTSIISHSELVRVNPHPPLSAPRTH